MVFFSSKGELQTKGYIYIIFTKWQKLVCFVSVLWKRPYEHTEVLTFDNAGRIIYDVLRANEQHLSLATPDHITR